MTAIRVQPHVSGATFGDVHGDASGQIDVDWRSADLRACLRSVNEEIIDCFKAATEICLGAIFGDSGPFPPMPDCS